tara:strand:- start:2020 stop:3342 length:1323 start_codon:yes stop_codon:yes gene_type:complete
MAGDQGIVNAYNRYFQAHEEANLQSDPFYQFTQIATQAAQEWNFEKKKDEERARKQGEVRKNQMTNANIKAAQLYNQQSQGIIFDNLAADDEAMDIAVKSGDKRLMNQIYSNSLAFANELDKGAALLKDHDEALADGTYSNAAGTASLNKLAANGIDDYEMFVEVDESGGKNVKIRTRDNNGGEAVLSFDELDKYNIKRADDFGGGYTDLIEKMVRKQFNNGLYEFDKSEVSKYVKNGLANGDVLASSFHDNVFGMDQSIKETFNANYGSNTDWQNVWNDKIETNNNVVSGMQGATNSGYNETAIREITEDKLMEFAEAEFNKRMNALSNKTKAGAKSSTGANVLGGHKTWEQIDDVAQDINNKKRVESLDNKSTWAWDNSIQKYVSGDTQYTQEELLAHNGIKYLYKDMIKKFNMSDYDGDGVPDVAPFKPIDFKTFTR